MNKEHFSPQIIPPEAYKGHETEFGYMGMKPVPYDIVKAYQSDEMQRTSHEGFWTFYEGKLVRVIARTVFPELDYAVENWTLM